MSSDDLPMISLSSDSTQLELTPQKEATVAAPEPIRQPARPASGPAPAQQADPRKASEARKPISVVSAPSRPASSDPTASRPAAPAVRPAPSPAPTAVDDEDPEKLLREYADRQKTKMVRLEQQVIEYKKVVSERDAYKAKVDALSKDLQDAKRQLEASVKSEEVIKDLQGKVDAAILSNSILSEDKEKLKKALSQQTENLKKSEDKNAQSEKSLAELEKELVHEADAREAAETKVAAALEALQDGQAPSAKPTPERAVSEAATRPMPTPAAPAPAPKAAEEKPAAAKAPAGRPGTAPGRFSFLKK